MSSDPRVGTDLAGYRIERVLGRGGMGIVYLAEQEGLGRKVALKVLSPELSRDEAFRARFVRESRTAASIDHPNIIPIFEAGESDGELFIAMRYVETTDLADLLTTHGRLEFSRTLSIIEQAASALDAAHAQGLIHRDVKPGNLLVAVGAGLGAGDHVYLSDFGLTKRQAAENRLTLSGSVVGTSIGETFSAALFTSTTRPSNNGNRVSDPYRPYGQSERGQGPEQVLRARSSPREPPAELDGIELMPFAVEVARPVAAACGSRQG